MPDVRQWFDGFYGIGSAAIHNDVMRSRYPCGLLHVPQETDVGSWLSLMVKYAENGWEHFSQLGLSVRPNYR